MSEELKEQQNTSEKKNQEEEDGDIEEREENLPAIPVMRLFRMNAPEWTCILIGSLASASNGVIDTGNAFLFTKVFGVRMRPPFIYQYTYLFLLNSNY